MVAGFLAWSSPTLRVVVQRTVVAVGELVTAVVAGLLLACS